MNEGPSGTAEIQADERLWAVLAHRSFFVLGIVSPLIIWLVHDSIIKRKSAFVEHHGKQATVYQIVAMVAIFVITFATCGFGVVVVPVFMIPPIMAAIAASKNQSYAYPGLSGITADSRS